MSDVMIEAQNLTKRYGSHRALDNASFRVNRGEVLGLLGPNGAGKSTTMKILTCFIAPSAGTARINGHDIWEDSLGVRASIGYLPESNPLYTEMLVLEYLEFIAAMRGLKGQDARKRIRKVAEETDIGDFAGKEIRILSKGQKQRVGLSQALLHEPPVLILDEPMSGLDPNQAQDVRKLIREIGKERTVILSTHNLAEVMTTCQRAIVVAKGKIVADGAPEELAGRGGKRSVATFRKSDECNAEELLKSIPDIGTIRSIPAGDDLVSFEIVGKSDATLRAAIYEASRDSKCTLVELGTRLDFDAAFRDLTLGSAPARRVRVEDDHEDGDE